VIWYFRLSLNDQANRNEKNEKWKMANGKWQMENDKSQSIANKKYQIANTKYQISDPHITPVPFLLPPHNISLPSVSPHGYTLAPRASSIGRILVEESRCRIRSLR